MRTGSCRVISLLGTLLFSTVAFANVPNTDNPSTFLGPIARGGVTTTVTDTTAASIAGEAGLRNFRVGGTVSWTDLGSNRFKLSAEYLWQNINYAFFSGNDFVWVRQGALGADYQYVFDADEYSPLFDLSVYISRAPSKNLSTKTVSYINSSGQPTFYNDARRVAGSNAYGVSPGFSFQPWDGGNLGANVNYDNVRYKTIYSSSPNAAKGLGGTAHFNQAVSDNTEIGFVATVRKPFNNYQANVAVTIPTCYGTWIVGANGAYTIGKRTLPSTYDVGLNADFLIDQTDQMGMTQRQATQSFLGWTAKPAVYMPQVLAIPESGTNCVPPSFSGQIGQVLGGLGIGFLGLISPPYDVGSNFTGTNLTYTLNLATPNIGNASITPTGILSSTVNLTIAGLGSQSGLSVTASNQCGSATSNSFVISAGA